MNESVMTSEPVESAASAAGAPSSPAVRVWLVDDNDQLRTLVARVLGDMKGIECVRHFSSPNDLLSALASKPGPDVILLDVQMGEHNGLDAVRPIKSLTRSTRVLMFTTCFNREWQKRALDEGASDYLLKTVTMERLAARIRNPAGDPGRGFAIRRRPSCAPARPGTGRPASAVTKMGSILSKSHKIKLLHKWFLGSRVASLPQQASQKIGRADQTH